MTCASGVFTKSSRQNNPAGLPLGLTSPPTQRPFPLAPLPPLPLPLPPRHLPLPPSLPFPLNSRPGEELAALDLLASDGAPSPVSPTAGATGACPAGCAGAEGRGDFEGERLGDLLLALAPIRVQSMGGRGLGDGALGVTFSFLE